MHLIGDDVKMQLTSFTDYALRTLLYLAVRSAEGDGLVPIAEVSAAYGISNHHLTKVAHLLARTGFVSAVRGRGGGLQLARAAGDISVGAVVRACEPNLDLVECFDRAHNTCPIASACALARVLAEARERFLATLDECTLAELARPGAPTQRLLTIWRRTAGR